MRTYIRSAMLMAGLVLVLSAGGALGLENTTAEAHLTSPGGITIDGTGTDGADLSASHFTTLTTSAKLYADSNIVISGTGALTVGSAAVSTGMQTWNTADPYADYANIHGITLNSNDSTLTVGNETKGSYLETGALVMTAGTINVAGTLDGGTIWADGAFLTGGYGSTVAVDLTGGIVNLGTNGRIQSTRENDPAGQQQIFHIGDVTINMTGDGSMIRAMGGSAQTTAGDSNGWHTRLVMDGGAINVTGNGYILAREAELIAGAITVNTGKTLTVAGSAADNASLDTGIGAAAGQWGDFTISGATIENKGVIDLTASADMNLNASGGSLVSNLALTASTTGASDGNTYSKNLHVVEGGDFTLAGDLTITTAVGVELENKGTLSITGATKSDMTITLADGSTTNFGGNVDITNGGGLTAGKNTTVALNNGSNLTAAGTLAVDKSSNLVINGNGNSTGTLTVGSMSVGGDSSAKAIEDYLLTQNSSGIASGKEYTWDGSKITYVTTHSANSTAGMTSALNKVGNGRLMEGLTVSATDTWVDIIDLTDDSLIPSTPRGVETGLLMDTYLNRVTENTPADEQRAVVSALAGWDSAKSLDVAMLTAGNVTGRIQGRVADNNYARANADERFGTGDALASAMLNCDFANRFWVGGFGLWEDADQRGFDSGYEYRSGGFIAGYDRVFGPLTVGGSFAYTTGSYEDKNSLSSDSSIDSYAFNLYGTYNHASGFFATVIGGYTYSDYDMANLMTRAGQWNRSTFKADTWSIGGSLGYDFRPTACLTVTPSVGLYYYTSATDTFATTLSNNMKVEQDSAELPVDLTVNYTIPTAGGAFRLTANTGYAYSFSKDGGELDAFGYNGINGSRISGIKGRENARHTWNVGAGLAYSAGRFDVGVKYDYYMKSDYDAHRVLGTVGISF